MFALRWIFAALIGLLVAACGPSKADRDRLARDEAIVRTDPDSALAILDSITPGARGEFAARAVMVDAEAAYQQSRRVASDSILDAALDYYRTAPDSPQRLRAFYLHGYQNYLDDRYAQALVDYLTAEQSAKALSDSITLGLIYRAMGDVYYQIKDYRSSLDNYKLSNEIFESLKCPEYYPYSALLLGQGYYNAFNYQESINTLRPLLSLKEEMDSLEQASLYSVIAFSYINMNQGSEAKPYVETVRTFYPQYMSERFLQNAGHLAYILKNPDDFVYFLEALHQNAPDNTWLDYLASCNRHDYKQALELLQKEYVGTDSFYSNALANDLRTVAVDYVSNRNDYLREKNRRNTYALVWISSIALLIILCLVIYLVYKRRLQAMVDEDNNEFVRQLSETIERYRTELAEQAKQIKIACAEQSCESSIETRPESTPETILETLSKTAPEPSPDSEHETSSVTSLDLLAVTASAASPVPCHDSSSISFLPHLPAKFDALSTLCDTYYSYKATKNIKSRIYDQLSTLISSLKYSSAQFAELTDFIDHSHNNIFTRFKTHIPSANENELEIFAFLVLGFSAKVIAVIQDISTDQFYARKTYLKKKISRLDSEIALDYLKFF